MDSNTRRLIFLLAFFFVACASILQWQAIKIIANNHDAFVLASTTALLNLNNCIKELEKKR